MTFKKGNVPWNKGTKGIMKAWNKGKKCDYLLGNQNGFKKGNSAFKGRKHSENTKEFLSELHKENWKTGKEKVNSGNFKRGTKPHNYIDGRSRLVKMIRAMREYLKWRSDVFKRDNYHCQSCGEKGYLEAHHIIPFIKILREFKVKTFEDARKCKLIWDIGNGISYCRNCHILSDTNRGRELLSQAAI